MTNGTLAVGSNRFAATGAYTNTATITIGAGSIIHAVELFRFSDSSGANIVTFTAPTSVYLTVTDPNRNLDGASAETMTVTVTLSADGGSDSETVTLTETTVDSGVFRNGTAMNMTVATARSLGNGQFEITASGLATGVYADTLDAADTAQVQAVFARAGSSGGGGSSGSGGGSSISTTTTPAVVPDEAKDANLQNLQNIGISVHQLLKLPNDGNLTTQEDSAVYYVGTDGKRHAFPNEKVYFTWFKTFGEIQVSSLQSLSSIPLGSNVTYKPGKMMVKFRTDTRVYAVERGGTLRWVTSEQVATELYGTDWNTKIDDIDDAFFTNYSIGSDIMSIWDFNPKQTEMSATNPSDSLRM